ncbi:hypothetical protein BOTBODRAFT_73957, partial [Botryobasidium botryosum FD-172 SS1]
RYNLTAAQWSTLEDILSALPPHQVQQAMSSETTPTLSMAIPAMEALLSQWTQLAAHTPHLNFIVSACCSKLQEYLSKMQQSKAYVIAMFLNPGCKFQWIETHW